MNSASQRSSFDLTARNTMSNSRLDEARSQRWSARIGVFTSPSGMVTLMPFAFSASTCAGHWSITVGS
jgi:hypothetical protein